MIRSSFSYIESLCFLTVIFVLV